MELRDFINQVFELHAAGDYAAARQIIVDVTPEVPEDDLQTITFYRVCLDTLTDRGDAALDLLEESLERGWWFGEQMLCDTDLDAIREHPRFEVVAAQSMDLQAAASGQPCSPIVVEPSGTVSGTVVALHANGGRSTHTARIWSPVTQLGYRLISVESSQKVTSDRAAWDDLDRSIADITSQLATATEPMILGGRSLGASVALHLATSGIVPAAGLILVAPSPRWDLITPQQPIPTVVIAGENDRETLRAGAEDLAEHLDKTGCPVLHQEIAGMGHFYPDDFEPLLTEAVGWIETQAT